MTRQIFTKLCVLLLAVCSGCHGASIDSSGCDVTKGCIRSPNDCSGDNCDKLVTWTPPAEGETNVLFELQGKTDGWVAVGFSKDSAMGDDSVVECLNTDSGVLVQASYNNPPKGQTETLGQAGLSETSGEVVNGLVRCTFRRDITNADAKVFNLNKGYILLLGVGPVFGTSKGKHAEIPLVSSEEIDVTADTSGGSAEVPKSPLVKAHGILMTTAWTILVGTAILLARYFKKAWPGKLLCDKKPVWFSVHRIANISVLLFTVIAFVLIFVEVQGYTQGTDGFSRAHPILGIIVTALAITNPLMALFRPAPDAEKRYIFNWLHWGVGTLASTLAVVTMYLGMSLSKATTFTASWVKYVLVGYVALYAVTVIVLEIHRCMVNKKQGGASMEMQSPGDQKEPEPQSMVILYVVFAIYIVAALILYGTMLVAMATG